MLNLYFNPEFPVRVFTDKPTIEVTSGIRESFGVTQYAGDWYWYNRTRNYFFSIFIQMNPGEFFGVSLKENIVRGTNGDLLLPFLEPTFMYKSVEYGTAFDQTINEELYTVTPAKIHFEYALGSDIKKSSFLQIEICNKK